MSEESDFNTCVLVIAEVDCMIQINEKTGIHKSLVIATVTAIQAVVKNEFHCRLLHLPLKSLSYDINNVTNCLTILIPLHLIILVIVKVLKYSAYFQVKYHIALLLIWQAIQMTGYN